MNHASKYFFGKEVADILPDIDIDTVMTVDAFLGTPPSYSNHNGFQADAFFSDGTPVKPDADIVYPIYAPRYLGTPIPEALMRIEESYSRTAAKAAVSWAMAIHGRHSHPQDTYDALSFQYDYQGHTLTVQFPVSEQLLLDDAIVIPVADTFRNDSNWGQGAIPYYVELHTRFMLWCYQHYLLRNGKLANPNQAYVARIIGNLPTDVMLYTIYADPVKDQKVADRVFQAFAKAQTAGINPMQKCVVQPEIPWKERLELEMADAYQTDDTAFFELIQQYMAARSERKELEAQDKKLKAEADAIAVSLAALTDGDASSGKLVVGETAYTVKHTPSKPQPPKVTAALVYQLAPKYARNVVCEKGRKVTVQIDVL